MNLAQFLTTWANVNGTFKTNGTKSITATNMRQFSSDIGDTFGALADTNINTVSKIEDEMYMGLPDGWVVFTSGAGATTSTSIYGLNSTENAIGVMSLSTGTTSTGSCQINTLQYIIINAGFRIVYTTRISLEALGNGTDRYSTINGLRGSNNGCYFQYADNVNSGKWQCVTEVGGVKTTNDTGVTATTTYSVFLIDIAQDGSSVKFYIDDVLVATHTTNIPTSVNLLLTHVITKSVGGTATLLDIDYYSVSFTRTTTR